MSRSVLASGRLSHLPPLRQDELIVMMIRGKTSCGFLVSSRVHLESIPTASFSPHFIMPQPSSKMDLNPFTSLNTLLRQRLRPQVFLGMTLQAWHSGIWGDHGPMMETTLWDLQCCRNFFVPFP